jgi:hypothetical protein
MRNEAYGEAYSSRSPPYADQTVSAPISDEDLTRWAREHLVYEGKMLAYTAIRLSEIFDRPRDQESNLLLEGFAIHTRCLRDFLWGRRTPRQPMDAFAVDFCTPGAWELKRGSVPPALSEMDNRKRLGREVVHLSYLRLEVPADIKDWPVSEIVREILDGLYDFAFEALPARVDDDTRRTLTDLASPSPGVGPLSVATGMDYQYTGGTIELPDFVAGS